MNDRSIASAWVEAGKLLAADPGASVPCPVNGDATLVVTDIPIAGSKKFERLLACPKCGARNVLLMTAKP